MIRKFRKKPVIIEAIQLQEDTFPDVMQFTKELGGLRVVLSLTPPMLVIKTLEGDMVASENDWIIKEPFPTDGRTFYPCKSDIFEKTYEEILCPVLQKKTDRERYDGIVSQTNFSDDGRRYKTNGHLNPKVTLKTESYDRIKNIYPE